ncbi:MAG: sulfatase-like hydrolase/transferase [Phycisphaerae bacterium]
MSTTANRPNIVFLFSDQQRWDTVGAYGEIESVTPNLDRLAGEGVLFENAFTCQPVCGPARACIQTGKYATETGCYVNNIALPADERTIAHVFNDAGYQTAYVGKWHLASTGDHENYKTKPVPPERRGGWDDYWVASDVLEFTSHGYDGHMFDKDGNRRDFPEGRYRADATADFALEFLRRQRYPSRPFCLMVSWIEPHHQNDNDRFEGPQGSPERFGHIPPPSDLTATDAEGDYRQGWPEYLGCCASLDENVGRIRDTLKELGLADNTVIVYTSDHGCHFRTRNAEYKRSCHESSIRIPMIAAGGSFRGGKVVRELVSLIDLPPTLLDEAGLDVPDTMRGRPLGKLTAGEADDWPGEVFLQISEDHVGRAIRTRKWKYAVWVPSTRGWSGTDQPGSDVYQERFLYDLDADPDETNNLVTDPALGEVRCELARRLKRRMVQAGEPEPEIRPAAD